MSDPNLEKLVNDLVEKKLAEMQAAKQSEPRSLALIASKGSLDWAYPPMILASTAGAMGWKVDVFFTFYGLLLLKKEIDPAVTPLGNPVMPMKMPFGPSGFQAIDWPIPTLMQAAPGFNALTRTLMKMQFKNKGVASIPELREVCIETGVNLIACQMTMEVFGFTKEEFIPECTVAGAATFLETASKADVQLFV
jgi:peroxiredoxin family protein